MMSLAGGTGWGKPCSPYYGLRPSCPVGRVSSRSQGCGLPAYFGENPTPPLLANFLFEDLCFPSLFPPSFFLFPSSSFLFICFFLFFSAIHLFPSLFLILSLSCVP